MPPYFGDFYDYFDAEIWCSIFLALLPFWHQIELVREAFVTKILVTNLSDKHPFVNK